MSPLFEKLIFIDDEDPREGALQMAVDEHLLNRALDPTLRVYRWIRPTVSLGCFEHIAAAREKFSGREGECGIDFVRRWTGGGIVLHEEDFTYALIVPRSHAFAHSRPLESYRAIHQVLALALRELGVDNELVGVPADSAGAPGNGICFESPVESDLLSDGRKISGAGQRRGKKGLLHQGTIQGIEIPKGLGTVFANQLASKVHCDSVPDWNAVDATKYRSLEWLERR